MEFFRQQLQHTPVCRIALIGEIDHHDVVLLSITMAATNALFYPLRIPRQVVVHYQRTELQVDTFGTSLGGDEDLSLIPEVIDDGSSTIDGWTAGDTIRALVRRQPALMDPIQVGIGSTPTELHDAPGVPMPFEKTGKVILRADRLREHHGFAWGAHGRHAIEAGLQRLQQGVGLLIFTHTTGDEQVLIQFRDLTAQLDGIKLRFGFKMHFHIIQSLIVLLQEVGIDVFVLDETFDPVVLFGLALLQSTQAGQDGLQRGNDRFGGRSQQLAQDQPHQVTLSRWDTVTVLAHEVAGHQVVDALLVIARRERKSKWFALGVLHILQHIAAQRALGEVIEPGAQTGQGRITAHEA